MLRYDLSNIAHQGRTIVAMFKMEFDVYNIGECLGTQGTTRMILNMADKSIEIPIVVLLAEVAGFQTMLLHNV